MDGRVYYECDTCGDTLSGPDGDIRLEDKLDDHERENPGHRMFEEPE